LRKSFWVCTQVIMLIHNVPFSSYYGRHIPLVHTASVPFGQAHVHVAAHVLRVEQYLPKATYKAGLADHCFDTSTSFQSCHLRDFSWAEHPIPVTCVCACAADAQLL
jgi:hypothetical protein